MCKPIVHIAYAEDHTLVRNLLIELINTHPGFKVVADAINGKELIDKITQLKTPPEICILDISMPVMNGYVTLYELKKRYPGMKFLVVTMFEKKFCIVRMIRIGVNGYLYKGCTNSELMDAIHAIYATGYYYTPQASEEMYKVLKKKEMPDLTPKEIQFICLCYTDLSYKEIANIMCISERTTEDYQRIIGKKIGMHSRRELALFAIKTGLVFID